MSGQVCPHRYTSWQASQKTNGGDQVNKNAASSSIDLSFSCDSGRETEEAKPELRRNPLPVCVSSTKLMCLRRANQAEM